MEKVPSNSQLEIEGNRSGSVLYSHVSKYRYPSVRHTDQLLRSGRFSSRLPMTPLGVQDGGADIPGHLPWRWVVCAVFALGVSTLQMHFLQRRPQQACPYLQHLGRGFLSLPLPFSAASVLRPVGLLTLCCLALEAPGKHRGAWLLRCAVSDIPELSRGWVGCRA